MQRKKKTKKQLEAARIERAVKKRTKEMQDEMARLKARLEGAKMDYSRVAAERTALKTKFTELIDEKQVLEERIKQTSIKSEETLKALYQEKNTLKENLQLSLIKNEVIEGFSANVLKRALNK